MIILSLALSEACNLNCSYCNVDKLSKKQIDADIALAEYQKLRSLNPNELIQIDFYGGEPLIQWPIVTKIVDTLANEPRLQFFMPTNGLLLDSDKVEYLNKHKVQVSLSFDGLWQDKNRLQLTGKSTLKRYIDKMPLFHQLNNLQVHTMVQRGCYNLLENHQYILGLTGVNPELTLVRDISSWDNRSVSRINDGISELFAWYIDNHLIVDMPYFVKTYLGHIVLYKAKKHEVKTCGAGVTHFSLSENKVVPCNRFKDEPDTIAKIPEFTVMSKCSTCEVKNYCKKGCLYEQIHNNGPIDELCDIYKHIYRCVFNMINTLQSSDKFIAILKEEIKNER